MKLDNTKKALKSIAHESKESVKHLGKLGKAITFDLIKGAVDDVRIDRALVRKARALVDAGLVTLDTESQQ